MSRFNKLPVAIIGGGISGLVLARALAVRGIDHRLIEPSPPPKRGTNADLRVITLTPASSRILARLGVEELDPPAHAFAQMRVWERGDGADLVLEAADAGLRELGAVAENEAVRRALWSLVDEARRIPSGVASVITRGDGAEIVLTDGETLHARLVAGCEGGRSIVREATGIEVVEKPYHQRGLVCNVTTDRADVTAIAWQRFLPGGPLAFLPLGAHTFSIVWSLPTGECAAAMECDNATFMRKLNHASEGRVGKLDLASARLSFPLRARRAERYVGPSVALVGDAAHVVHPLAGQGANLGILDAVALAEVLDAEEPADPARLRAYERWRRADNAIMETALDTLHRFYQAPDPVAGVRRVGAGILSHMPWMKRRIITHASGLGGKVPALARGIP